MSHAKETREIGAALQAHDRAADTVAPIVGARYPLERAADALLAIERREALGKVVLDLGLDLLGEMVLTQGPDAG